MLLKAVDHKGMAKEKGLVEFDWRKREGDWLMLKSHQSEVERGGLRW